MHFSWHLQTDLIDKYTQHSILSFPGGPANIKGMQFSTYGESKSIKSIFELAKDDDEKLLQDKVAKLAKQVKRELEVQEELIGYNTVFPENHVSAPFFAPHWMARLPEKKHAPSDCVGTDN